MLKVEKKVVYVNGEQIPFELRQSRRKSLVIRFDEQLLVLAPNHMPSNRIQDFLNQKSHWIFKNWQEYKLRKQKAARQSYLNGGVLPFLGEDLQLEVIQDRLNAVQHLDCKIRIFSKKADDEEWNRSLLEKWYRERASQIFTTRLEKNKKRFSNLSFGKIRLSIRKMKKRWGSCSKAKSHIILNLHLVKAPLECIDYVIIHELCHLFIPNHSQRFYSLQTEVLPDWKEHKKLLEDSVCLSFC